MENHYSIVERIQSTDTSIVSSLITSEDPKIGQVLRMLNIEGSEAEDLERRRTVNKHFVKCLVEVKSGLPSALLWLKANVDMEICDKMILAYNHSETPLQVLKERSGSIIKAIKSSLSKGFENVAERVENKCGWCLTSSIKLSDIYDSLFGFFSVAVAYLDLSFDLILLSTVFTVLGATIGGYELFSTQIAALLLMSIWIPFTLTALNIICHQPLVLLGPNPWIAEKRSNDDQNKNRILILQVIILVVSPFIPALIIRSEQKANQKRKYLKDQFSTLLNEKIVQESDLEEAELITKFLDECRLAMLTFKRQELSIELVIQLSVHLAMVLLSQSDFPVESGLQSIFKSNKKDGGSAANSGKAEEDSNKSAAMAFLILSILWSFKTSAMTSIKIKTESKMFMPLGPKLLLGIRYLMVFMTRIKCIVVCFAGVVGLLGSLNHHHAERLALSPEIWNTFNTNSQSWTFGNSKLINEAGFWKSEDTWNLMPLQPEIFNGTATKGNNCEFIEVTDQSTTEIYVKTDERLPAAPNNSIWKHPDQDRYIFNTGNVKRWRIGAKSDLTTEQFDSKDFKNTINQRRIIPRFSGDCHEINEIATASWSKGQNARLSIKVPKATSEWKVKIIFDKDITRIKVYGGINEECDGKMCTFTNAVTKSLNKDENLRLGIKNSDETTKINIVGIEFNDEIICGSPINLAIATSTATPTTSTTTTTTTPTPATAEKNIRSKRSGFQALPIKSEQLWNANGKRYIQGSAQVKCTNIADVLNSTGTLINEGKVLYYVINTSKNKLLGTKDFKSISKDKVSPATIVGTHNDFKHHSTNLWIKEEVINEDRFKLIHLESKKFLTATPASGLALEKEYDGLYHYWNPRINQFQNVTMTNLFRSNYKNIKAPQPPPTTLYTQIKLRTVFILFWNGYLLYGILLILIKNYKNKNFAMASLGKKLQHIIEAVNMPEAFGDWDSDNSLTIKGHKELWNKILAEMMIMVGLQCLTNMILLTPLLITGYNVKVRHELLLEVLGYVFPEEEYSYWLMNLLMWVLPTTVAIAAAVDALLAFVYMKYAHPWRGILADPAPQEVIPEAIPVQSSSRYFG